MLVFLSNKELKQLDLPSDKIKCKPYHAGLPIGDRAKIQEEFMRDKVNVIISTIAFGLGLDKKNVNLVVHLRYYSPVAILQSKPSFWRREKELTLTRRESRCVEDFVQEVGRAGRDSRLVEEPESIVVLHDLDFIQPLRCALTLLGV